jgi:hypothetical protein
VSPVVGMLRTAWNTNGLNERSDAYVNRASLAAALCFLSVWWKADWVRVSAAVTPYRIRGTQSEGALSTPDSEIGLVRGRNDS